jgi:hypothetical protein
LKKLLASWKDARARHRERHRPTGFRFAAADSIAFLNGAHWDAVTDAAGFFLQRAYLSLLEDFGPENLELKCGLIYQDDTPLAAVVAQIINVSADRMLRATPAKDGSPNLIRKAFGPGMRKAGARIRDRVLVCGNLLSWGRHGVAFAPHADPAELWPAVAEAIYRIRRAEKLAGETNLLLLKDISPDADKDVVALRRFSYRPVSTDPDMVLTLRTEWGAYKDYLASLDGKYRKGALQIARQIENAGCRIERLEELESSAARLHELYLQVQENAAIRPVTLNPAYLPAVARLAGQNNFKCLVIRRGDDLLGFVTLLREADSATGYYIGFDRAAAQELPLYLRLLHVVVEEAIDWKCRRLSLGRTALEPKARLGAKPEPMCVYVRHRHPTLNFFIRKLVYAIPHQEAPERNPFKGGA